MKRTFALLLMTSGLCASLGTGSAVLAAGQGLPLTPDASLMSGTAPGAALTLIDGDEDEGESSWFWSLSEEDEADDCDDEDEDDDDDDDDEAGCAVGASGNAAKAGTAPPPQNGLFTNGTAPVVTSN
ncbi:hypothetical protein MCELHM10_03650 [Paracoccaceae bacterium]|jgi:hypothetical protein